MKEKHLTGNCSIAVIKIIDLKLKRVYSNAMKIDSYQFGEIVIDGVQYTSDLVIASGSIHTRWVRREGHAVALSDIKKYIHEDCNNLIIGTGASGLCRVSPEIEIFCKEKSISLFAKPTARAVEEFNGAPDQKRVVAAFHLTC
jgi:hypothetical protein